MPGIPFILSSLDPLLGWFFSSLLHCKYIYFGSSASLCLLRPYWMTQLWLPLQKQFTIGTNDFLQACDVAKFDRRTPQGLQLCH